jgi:hypothetical protein
VAVDVNLDKGLWDTPATIRLKIKDLLTSEVPHKVLVANAGQKPLWQFISKAAEEVENLTTTRLAETRFEPVACAPTIGMDSLPDPSENSPFRGNSGHFTYIH